MSKQDLVLQDGEFSRLMKESGIQKGEEETEEETSDTMSPLCWGGGERKVLFLRSLIVIYLHFKTEFSNHGYLHKAHKRFSWKFSWLRWITLKLHISAFSVYWNLKQPNSCPSSSRHWGGPSIVLEQVPILVRYVRNGVCWFQGRFSLKNEA